MRIIGRVPITAAAAARIAGRRDQAAMRPGNSR